MLYPLSYEGTHGRVIGGTGSRQDSNLHLLIYWHRFRKPVPSNGFRCHPLSYEGRWREMVVEAPELAIRSR